MLVYLVLNNGGEGGHSRPSMSFVTPASSMCNGIIRPSSLFNPHPLGRQHLCCRFPSQQRSGIKPNLIYYISGSNSVLTYVTLKLILLSIE